MNLRSQVRLPSIAETILMKILPQTAMDYRSYTHKNKPKHIGVMGLWLHTLPDSVVFIFVMINYIIYIVLVHLYSGQYRRGTPPKFSLLNHQVYKRLRCRQRKARIDLQYYYCSLQNKRARGSSLVVWHSFHW